MIRGGFGIAYGALSNIGFGGNIGVNYPFLYTNTFNSVNSFTPFLDPAGKVPTLETALTSFNSQSPLSVTPNGLNLQGRQYNFQTPYTGTYNVTIQDQFGQHDSAQVGYVGVFGRHLDGFGYHNSPDQILPVGTNIYNYIPFRISRPGKTMPIIRQLACWRPRHSTWPEIQPYFQSRSLLPPIPIKT